MERASPFLLLLLALGAVGGLSYMPHAKERFLSDLLLRDMVDRMSKDLAAAADSYLDLPENNRLQVNNILSNRVIKDLENEETSVPVDFERLSDNPNPSLRDQEYLQHSSLWGHQFMTGGAGEGKQRLKPDGSVKNRQQVKTDSTLPAYCNPPNPCPDGYTTEDGCLEEFENTAAFSRDFQTSQDCMCDSEHMFECPVTDFQTRGNELNSELDLDRIMEELSVEDQHKNLVAKKFHIKKDSNPYLKGEKLPVAAKKGVFREHIVAFCDYSLSNLLIKPWSRSSKGTDGSLRSINQENKLRLPNRSNTYPAVFLLPTHPCARVLVLVKSTLATKQQRIRKLFASA